MFEDKTLVCKECGQEFVFTEFLLSLVRTALFTAANVLQNRKKQRKLLNNYSDL